MTESEKPEEKPEKGRRFNQEQYDLLLRCSQEGDITAWDDWRSKHEGAEILLEGANLRGMHLDDIELRGAHLEGAIVRNAHLGSADLRQAHLEGAILRNAHLESSKMKDAHLESAMLRSAHLERTELWRAHLENANMRGTRLEKAVLWRAHLDSTDFSFAVVDHETLIYRCIINSKTNFSAVALDSARVDPPLRQALADNIRCLKWQNWFGEGNWCLRCAKDCTVRPFWWISDYGRSTGRILLVFLFLACVFALVYWSSVRADPPGLVQNLAQYEEAGALLEVDPAILPLRALYFSVITMTTLGFGDMYANPASVAGHLLLMIQVLFGYVLLGALITRFAVLFTGSGPPVRHSRAKSARRKD